MKNARAGSCTGRVVRGDLGCKTVGGILRRNSMEVKMSTFLYDKNNNYEADWLAHPITIITSLSV